MFYYGAPWGDKDEQSLAMEAHQFDALNQQGDPLFVDPSAKKATKRQSRKLVAASAKRRGPILGRPHADRVLRAARGLLEDASGSDSDGEAVEVGDEHTVHSSVVSPIDVKLPNAQSQTAENTSPATAAKGKKGKQNTPKPGTLLSSQQHVVSECDLHNSKDEDDLLPAPGDDEEHSSSEEDFLHVKHFADKPSPKK